MKITKPKKQDNSTYLSDITDDQKQEIRIRVPHAYIIDIKEMKRDTKNEDETACYALLFKNAGAVDKLCDINEQVIALTKKNCASWFKAALSDELIDDYFLSNIVYDNKRGQHIKIKCINDISQVPVRTLVNIEIVLQSIRFYKQQFVLEWIVDEVEIIDDKEHDDEGDADIPSPSLEDIAHVKKSVLERVQQYIDAIDAEISKLQERRTPLLKVKADIIESKDIDQVLNMADHVETLIDEVHE